MMNRLNSNNNSKNKYCSVRSCEYFHGTKQFDEQVHMFRYAIKLTFSRLSM